jgi:hypothetical protein
LEVHPDLPETANGEGMMVAVCSSIKLGEPVVRGVYTGPTYDAVLGGR